MRFFRLVPFLAGIILLIFYLGGCTESPDQKEKGLNGGRSQVDAGRAADFKLPDLEGRPFSLSQFRGNPVLLIFSTTWCAYCRSELPHFKEIHARYGPQGLTVVQIFVQESQRKVSSFARQYNLPYRVLLDEKCEVADSYGVRGVPDTILLDGDGQVLCRRCPDLDASLENLFRKPQPTKG